jgi:hypothetical protein
VSSTEVIFPYAGADPDRERALSWVAERCDFPYTVARSKLPFNKAMTLMPAIARSSAQIVVAHDADVWTPGLALAVQAVRDGAAWAVPHWKVHRLSAEATRAVLGGGEWSGQPLARPVYTGIAGGGVIVAHRDTFLDIPLDPRFHGWGQEDESWAMALWCLLGEPWRGEDPLVHLWHTLEPRHGQRMGSQAGWDLRNRYAQVRYDEANMRQLLQEAQDALLQPH